LRLSANESAYGPFPSIARAMAQAAAEQGAYYVGREAQKVRDKLAERFGVPARQVLLGAGSGEPLRVATEVFSEKGRPPVVAEPTFEAVARAAGIAGIEAVKIPLTPGGVHDVERMIEAARRHSAGLLYLVNPANPTGTIISGQQLAWVVENLPAATVLLADEAYCDFVDAPEYRSALPYVQQGKRVVVLRTFSKIYGLAGMRLGYAVGPPELIGRMAPRMLGGMALNQAVVAGALAGLEDKEHYQYIKGEYLRVRRYVIEEFAKLGYPSYPSQANFIMVDLRRPIEPVSARLAEKGFAVGRLFPSLPSHLRITLGKMEDMRRFMGVAREVLAA
jgi:histidinol-phosphate aminotransferase